MTTEEAIYRAALRKHRHKGNYQDLHLALAEENQRVIEEIEKELNRTEPSDTAKFWMLLALATGSWGLVILAWWLS